MHSDAKSSRSTSIPLLIFAAALLGGCAASMNSTNSDPPPPAGTGTINGTVVNGSTNQPIGNAIVLLEQPDSGSVDRVIQSTQTSSDGAFAFSSLASGNFDVVTSASLSSSGGTASTYATTVTFQVPPGSSVNQIPLVPEYGYSYPTGTPTGIAGVIAASGAGPASVDVKLSALQSAAPQGGSPVEVTIPAFAGSISDVTTAAGSTCATGANCANYVLNVPSSNLVVGTFNPAGTSYQYPTLTPGDLIEVIYSVEGRAFVPGTNQPDCNPATQTAGPIVPRGTLASRVPNLTFTGCQ